MPPLPRIVTPAISRLEDELGRLPRGQILGAIEGIELLPGDIDPTGSYPLDWIVFRLTGETGAHTEENGTIPGSDLLGDLSALAERLCERAGLTAQDHPPGSVLPESLERRWEIGRRTLDRYRRQGLVARRVRQEDGKAAIVFTSAAVRSFEKQRARAGAAIDPGTDPGGRRYSRITPELERVMVRRALVYRRRLGCSLSAAALRLADRFDRSHEGVRQLLIRHDASSNEPIFGRAIKPSSLRRGVAHRALSRGIEPSRIGRRWKRSSASVLRLAIEHRAGLLRSLKLGEPAHGSRDGGGDELEALLASAPVREDLGRPGETDLLAFLIDAREPRVPLGAVERARAIAMHGLITDARARIASLPASGSLAGEVDLIETRLRWAARLRAELIRSQFPLAVKTIEAGIGRELDRLRASELLALTGELVAAIASAVDRFEPGRGGRLASPAGLAVTRLASAWTRARHDQGSLSRATPQLRPGVVIADWTRSVSPWQAWLEPDRRIVGVLDRLGPDHASVLRLRFGWGCPPKTTGEVARELGVTVMQGARLERAAVREALAAARMAV